MIEPRFQHPYPLRGCNSDLAQYSITPSLHHSARPDSRTRTTTRTRTKRPVRAGTCSGCLPGVKTACKQARNIESPARVDCDPPLSPPPWVMRGGGPVLDPQGKSMFVTKPRLFLAYVF